MYAVFNNIQLLFFHLFLVMIIFTLFRIATQKNPVYAVFSFILTAIIVFLFLLTIGAEFFALLVLIIYTGVITVLFLFVVIIYNLRNTKEKIQLRKYFKNPIFWVVCYKVKWAADIWWGAGIHIFIAQGRSMENKNLFTLDIIYFIELFNAHYFAFLFTGLLIFIAILGSIVITYPFYKRRK